MAPHSLDMEPSPTPPLGASHTLPVNGHSTWNSSASHTTAPVATAEEVFSEKGFNIDKLRRPALPPGASSEYQKKKKFPRISRPVELLKRDYDVVVIGSGYGGSVAASRMARGRKSVCLLELGRERWPGEYPEDINEARHQLHLSGDFSTKNLGPTPITAGDTTGLYHLILGDGQNAFVANGLGGTSLLNANVFLEADDATLQIKSWPAEIRRNPDCLRKYYDRVRGVLEPQIYPDDFPALPKLNLLKKQAEVLGYEKNFRKVEQTTWFKEDGLNSSGVRMKKSKLTGMDCTGINDGSKSSTLMNYLADAWNWGAEIFTGCEVRYVKKHPKEGYLIFFAWHGSQRHRFKANFYEDLMWVHAKKMLFLGAGTLGTTEILLRSRSMGMSMSKNVGQNLSGNGDLLAFGYNLNTYVNGLGRPDPDSDAPIGPTISGIIDCREQDNPLDGFVIEDGAIPEALAPVMQLMLEFLPGRQRPKGISTISKFSKILASIISHFEGPYAPGGSLERTQTYLIMSHDENQGTLSLKNNRPNLQFVGVGRMKHVRKLNQKLKDATVAFNGTFVQQPFFALNSQQEITVHPIGGASMSRDGTGANGATNHRGELFTGEGKDCYKGLVVVDASVIPTPLGANPFATITALAERSVELIAKEEGINIDYETKNGELNFWGQPEHPVYRRVKSGNIDEEFVNMSLRSDKEGLEFTEIMSGHIHIGAEIDDFETAQRIAKGNCEQARFFLSVHAYDTHTLLASEDHKAMLTGTFTSGALPASPYMVTGGRFYLFRNDARAPEAKNLEYDFDMVGTDGSKIHFNGYKVINDMAAFSIRRIWGATTTLRVTLSTPTEDEEEEGRERVIGKGILFINPHDFIRELRSFYASLNSASQFVGFFARNLAKVFFAPFDHLDRPEYAYEAWHARNAPTHDFPVHASDGVKSRMMIWDPLSTERKHMDLLFIGGAAVDESIFALPTIKHNAIYHFRKQGYRCFCVVHRVGNCQNAQGKWTTYDARLDIAEAIKKIGRLRQSRKYGQLASKIYVIAHCAGAVALSAGILNNDIDTSSIAGMTISQVFMTPKFAMINRWKASIPLATNTYSALSKSDWYDCSSHPKDAYFQLILNQLLRLYPVRRKNLCNSVVCHRSSFIFGLLWSHQNLNDATHRTLHRFLGGTTMMNERHLIQMCNKGHVLRSDGTDDLVTAKNIERFRGIPVLFLCGAENGVYDPENLLTSFSTLRRQLEVSDYELERFDDFGHLDLWMSERSAEEIYPRVDDHLATVLERMKDQGVNGFAANGRADQRR